MSQKFSYLFFLLLYFSCNIFLNAQPQNDSLAKYSYEELRELYRNTENRKLIGIYAQKYLQKAKKDDNSIELKKAYYQYARIYYNENESLSLKYADSVIDISSIVKSYKIQSLAYYLKGYIYFQKGENQLALDNFFKALELIKKEKDIYFEIDIRNAIVGIESSWKSNEEILSFKKETLEFIIINKEEIIDYKETYLHALHDLSLELLRNKKNIKGLKIAQKGIQESLIYKDTLMYYEFVSNAGTAQYYLGNYQAAIDSLQKALPYDTDHGKAMSNYYLGKNYNKLNQKEKAHDHFLKVDFMYVKTQDLFPELRNTYEHIVEYYKEKGDTEQQLFFLERLIETDAKIDSTYKYVTETVQKKYETPQIITERNRLLEEAKEKQNAWKYKFGIISIILLAVLGILLFVFRRQKYYKKRFESLMAENANSKKKPNNISTALNVTNEKKKEIGVPKEVVESILNELSKFEDSKGFTKQITLAQLAKKLKTNPKYLSKVINWHYQKSYSSYINELRISHTIAKLKEEKTFRNYTIKAIAKEVGFGNAESFAKAFYKSTGINPSYFMKELQKRLES